MTSEDKTFILGVGAQKCGTSWLFSYLNRNPAIASSTYKELHFFDAIYNPKWFGNFNDGFARDITEELQRQGTDEFNADRLRDASLRINALYDRDLYLTLFERNATRATTHFLEITPTYSTLSEDQLREVRSLILSRCQKIKVIFLMRDPAERLYSLHKHRTRAGTKRLEKVGLSSKFLARKMAGTPDILDLMKEPAAAARGRYDQSITALQAAFPEEELHFEFYENLFSTDAIRSVCQFLNVDFVSPDLDQRVNASPDSLDASTETFEQVREHLDPVYRFCADRFPDTLPKSWMV
ncbi:MAG: sulfotransferase domain-containing protein [Pseudomonadota bacterium]